MLRTLHILVNLFTPIIILIIIAHVLFVIPLVLYDMSVDLDGGVDAAHEEVGGVEAYRAGE